MLHEWCFLIILKLQLRMLFLWHQFLHHAVNEAVLYVCAEQGHRGSSINNRRESGSNKPYEMSAMWELAAQHHARDGALLSTSQTNMFTYKGTGFLSLREHYKKDWMESILKLSTWDVMSYRIESLSKVLHIKEILIWSSSSLSSQFPSEHMKHFPSWRQ